MPFVQGEFREDFRFIQYGNTAESAVEPALDLGFPPVQSAPAGIPDLTFPSFDEDEPIVQPHESAKAVKAAGESKRVGVMSHIRGWFK